jgi:isocitrate/isopropylmalate dehydrogenase
MSGKRFEIAVLPGDGIGPEVTAEGVKVLRCARKSLAKENDDELKTSLNPSRGTQWG